jgi:hypothetical protein
MKWYDYIVCFLIADYLTAMLFVGSILVFIPYLIFELYCDFRKEQETRK